MRRFYIWHGVHVVVLNVKNFVVVNLKLNFVRFQVIGYVIVVSFLDEELRLDETHFGNYELEVIDDALKRVATKNDGLVYGKYG